MEGTDCEDGKLLGGAVIYSHLGRNNVDYGNNIECRITFKAGRNDWKLMLRVVELDIPDVSYNELCNDALYVYDADTILGRAMVSTHSFIEFFFNFSLIFLVPRQYRNMSVFPKASEWYTMVMAN